MELPVEYTELRDVTKFNRDGSTYVVKRAVFYLGKFGPFTEEMPIAEFTETALKLRVDALRRQVEALHR